MILDTNALSAIADGDAAVGRVLGSEQLLLPVVVLGEYRFGIRRSRFRTEYEAWLDQLIDAVELLPVVAATTVHYAAIFDELRTAGTPIPTNDAWIAALAREHDAPIVTNDAHFAMVSGVTPLGWV